MWIRLASDHGFQDGAPGAAQKFVRYRNQELNLEGGASLSR
jgi:hypothetical protein